MSQIKLELALDASKPNEVKAFADFLYAIAGQPAKFAEGSPEVVSNQTQTDEKITETDKPKQTRSRSKAAAPKTEEAESTETVQASDASAETETKKQGGDDVAEKSGGSTEKSAAVSEISLDMIREVLAKKIDAHRDTIREAMAKTGAKNITTLKEEDYEDFYNLIKGLK